MLVPMPRRTEERRGGERRCSMLQVGYICLQPRCPPRLCSAGTGWGQVMLSWD